MASGFRDMPTPYTEEEIEGILKVVKSCPTWSDEDGGSICVSDFETQLQAMRYDRSGEQIKCYKEWIQANTNGRVHWNHSVSVLKNLHTNHTYAKSLAQICDKDGNGFITEDEFKEMLDLLVIHDPKFAGLGIKFEDFVKEADSNQDGKVSIEECTKWIQDKEQF